MKFLNAFHNIPLGKKLTWSILGTCIMAILVVSITVMILSIVNERNEMHNELTVMAQMVGDNSSAAIVFGDNFAAQDTLNALKVRRSIESACLYTTNGEVPKLFADYQAGQRSCPDDPMNNDDPVEGLIVNVPIKLRGSTIGIIHLRQNYEELLEILVLYMVAITLSVVLALVVAWLLAVNLKSLLAAPILDLTATANRISATGDYSLRAKNYGEDEVGQLIQRFNSMLTQIQQQNVELLESRNHLEERVAERTQEIEEAMRQLTDAQKQLVQSENLAALGGLVAGVAHEINTPVGVGMTASSSLHDHSREILDELEHNSLTKQGLFDYVENAVEATDIILKNLSRAANLVRSFKQVAIDQSGLERRKINIREYFDNILTSLRPKLKKTAHVIQVDCPDELMLETYPGALSQIVTNLLMNSIAHAFDEGQAGHIDISVQPEGSDIKLVYADDGKGIPAQYMQHIFEPFFTTKRNEGGSGLGLHIVHNIVTQTLNGSIRLTSTAQNGFQLVIMMPAELPANNQQHGPSEPSLKASSI